jgi:hypothetical protein
MKNDENLVSLSSLRKSFPAKQFNFFLIVGEEINKTSVSSDRAGKSFISSQA